MVGDNGFFKVDVYIAPEIAFGFFAEFGEAFQTGKSLTFARKIPPHLWKDTARAAGRISRVLREFPALYRRKDTEWAVLVLEDLSLLGEVAGPGGRVLKGKTLLLEIPKEEEKDIRLTFRPLSPSSP